MKCRICEQDIDEVVFSLGEQPMSNNYLPLDSIDVNKYPLDIYFCDSCKFLQLDEIVLATDIFKNDYPYVSSCSSSWLKHCEDYANKVIDRFELNSKSYVMEIASNDGCLLEFFKNKNIRVKGVEPASSVAAMAIDKGIDTDVEFFNTEYAERISKSGKLLDLVIANNVIAHNPNVKDFLLGVSKVLARDGVFTVEFPHLYNLLKYKQFDTIYHEHYSYFSLYSMMILMHECGLCIFDVEEIPTHGGSLRVYAKLTTSREHFESIRNIDKVFFREAEENIYSISKYKDFNKKIQLIRDEVKEFFAKAAKENKRVVAYGAPAKGNTFLNYCGIDNTMIEYTVDKSEYKIGKKLPGSNIPIYSVYSILEDDPDYIFILPWNIKDEIISFLGEDKAKFVTAIPELKIL